MKTIEEINQSNVKKIISERKHPDFFPGDIIKVGVRITEGKEIEFSILKVSAQQKKIEILIHHLQ